MDKQTLLAAYPAIPNIIAHHIRKPTPLLWGAIRVGVREIYPTLDDWHQAAMSQGLPDVILK
jgi:hypothetical protein